MKRINYNQLSTEQPNPASHGIDQLSPLGILRLMNQEDAKLSKAIKSEIPKIKKAVELMVQSLKFGGHIFFVGAGTSGRLGVLESAELPPTFNTPPSMAQAFMAGGRAAVFRSQEGAEDNAALAIRQVREKVRKGDVLIGIAASGVTPFAQAAMAQANKMGAKTIFITCNNVNSEKKHAHVTVAPKVGPEIITGSTRLKSGTATKMILNMLTTVSMVQMGKVYGNKMVDLQPRSKKLKERGIRLIQEFTGLPRTRAVKTFQKAKGHVKTAIVMIKKQVSLKEAQNLLKSGQGYLRQALKNKR